MKLLKSMKVIINSLLSYNNKYSFDFKKRIMESIEKDKKNYKEKNNNKDKDTVSFLVKEIVSMERDHFNEENKEDNEDKKYNSILIKIIKDYNEFIAKPPSIIPNISYYSLISVELTKRDLDEEYIKKKGYNVHIGDFEIKFKFKQDNFYSTLCKFYFKNTKNAIFFISQKKKLIDSNTFEIIPMKLSSNKNIWANSNWHFLKPPAYAPP